MNDDERIIVTETPNTTTISNQQPVTPISTFKGQNEIKQNTTTEKVVKGFNFLSMGKYILIILILAFLGFNIFTALGDATDKTTGILGTLLEKIGYGAGETVKQTVNTVARGAKLGVNVAAGSVDDAVDLIEKGVGVKNVKFNRIDNKNISTEKAIKNAQKNKSNLNTAPEPDDAMSSTQKSQNKAGYCYIGEDRGFRSCIKVGEGDKCMSGEIFPSQDICINPNLRN
tara:strand:+ start:9651 stop:10334 length:684 start_codon:yes stop_codon:yes gene_type:complete